VCTGNEGGSAYPPPQPPGTLRPIGVGASAYFIVERGGGLVPHPVELWLGTERMLHNPQDCGIPAVRVPTILAIVETGQGP